MRYTIDSDEQVALRRFVRHLQQRFDIDVEAARLIPLEGFLRRWFLAFQNRNEIAQVRDVMTAQATAQASARDGLIEESCVTASKSSVAGKSVLRSPTTMSSNPLAKSCSSSWESANRRAEFRDPATSGSFAV